MKMHIYEETIYDQGSYTEDKGIICDACLRAEKAQSHIVNHDSDGTLVIITRIDAHLLRVMRVDNPAQYLDACETLQSQPCDCCWHVNEVAA